jgi:hypothetical protein
VIWNACWCVAGVVCSASMDWQPLEVLLLVPTIAIGVKRAGVASPTPSDGGLSPLSIDDDGDDDVAALVTVKRARIEYAADDRGTAGNVVVDQAWMTSLRSAPPVSSTEGSPDVSDASIDVSVTPSESALSMRKYKSKFRGAEGDAAVQHTPAWHRESEAFLGVTFGALSATVAASDVAVVLGHVSQLRDHATQLSIALSGLSQEQVLCRVAMHNCF